MRNIFRISFAALFATFVATSCTEKIDLKLRDSEPRIVIEGWLSDKPGPYFVGVTKSRLYSDNNQFEGIPSATVVISDDAGSIDTLTETTIPGLYQTNFIQGTVGRTYRLDVTAEGTTYTSICKMNTPVDIDSIVITPQATFGGEIELDAELYVRDPTGVRNFYRVFNVRSGEWNVYSDLLWDGKIRDFNIPDSGLESGDTLETELWSLDEHVFNYFDQFNQNQNNFGSSAAPANPDPVFTPAALGYFTAHSVKSKTVIVP